MFDPIENGTCIEIPDNAFGFVFKCWIPAPGYGLNVANGKIEKTDIFKRSEVASEQFWEKMGLPSDYDERRKKEREIQKSRPKYIDPYLENIRKEQWGRRLRGVWFWNNGELVYINGFHWMYLEHWKFQGKTMSYRLPDRDYFYVVQYCVEDIYCLGLNEITKRKNGKTARAGLVLYERTSRISNHHGGIQSKTDDDAEEFFKKAVIHPWQKLPHFFRPRYDLMKGSDPSELRFFATSRRGSKAEEDENELEEPLESFIDYKASGVGGYDGPQVETYVSDESGKLKEVSITERQNTVRYSCEVENEEGEINYRNILHLFTTTVEEMENGGSDFQELTKMSNPIERDENGRTKSGLYTIFLPSYRAAHFDRYGNPNEVSARTYFENTRKGLQDKPVKLSSFIRKNPFTLKEAFRVDGETCIFNPIKLNDQRDFLSWNKELVVRGNFRWENGIKDTNVVWEDTDKGRWEMPKKFLEEFTREKTIFENGVSKTYYECNQTEKRGSLFIPKNDHRFACGIDPYDHDETKDDRRSDGASLVKQKNNWDNMADPFIGAYICQYKDRQPTAALFYEDMIMQCFFFGCRMLFETQKIGIKNYFRNRGYAAFLMVLPGEQEPGIASSPNSKQDAAYFVEAVIEDHITKIVFIDLIEDWLKFNIKKTQPFDLGMASLWTEVAANNKLYSVKPNNNVVEISSIFRQYKIKSA